MTSRYRRFARLGLDSARVYSWLQRGVGSTALWERFVAEWLRPSPGMRILDLGCGPADILAFLPKDVEYTGIDTHRPYIENARARFGDRGRFVCSGVRDQALGADGPYDRVLMLGLLHHLDAQQARTLLGEVARLGAGGQLLSLDGCEQPGAPWSERAFYAVDRGPYVRSQEGYTALVQGLGPVRGQLWRGVLRVPYTYLCLDVRLPAAPGISPR